MVLRVTLGLLLLLLLLLFLLLLLLLLLLLHGHTVTLGRCSGLRWSGVESYVGVVLGGYVGALFGLARGAKFYNHFWKRVK